MQTQAYFDDIQLQILHEIRKATTSIHIAVAWFTDPEIFEQLCQKAGSGVRVELMVVNDSINRNSSIDYERLCDLGGVFMMVGEDKKRSAIMHNKFCVIDSTTVITGSYNWSRQAQQNSENITVISGHPELARQFMQEFESLNSRYVQDYVWNKRVNPSLRAIELFNKGTLLHKEHRYKEAIIKFTESIKISPKVANTYLNRGGAYYELGDHERAVADLGKAIELDQNLAVAYYCRGYAYSRLGQPHLAVNDFDRVIELKPNYKSAYLEQFRAHVILHNFPQAIECCDKAIMIDPKSAEAYYNRGLINLETGHKQHAITDFKKAASLGLQQAQAELDKQGIS